MSGSKSNGLFASIFSRKKKEVAVEKAMAVVDAPEPLEVMPGVKAGSKHLHRVIIYVPRKEHEFYLDGQMVSSEGRGVRLVHVKTGVSMALSKDVFDFMFEPKGK